MTEARFLLDTNVMIYLLAGSIEPLRLRVAELMPGEAVTSTICVAEVAAGLRTADAETLRMVERIYRIVEPLPLDRRAAERFGELSYRRGQSDRLIAAHALSLGLTLITNNERDFTDIPGLVVENWTR